MPKFAQSLAVAAGLSLAIAATPAIAQPETETAPAVRTYTLKNPWFASALSLGGAAALYAVAPPLAPLGLGAGHLYAGDPARAFGVALGGEAALGTGYLAGGIVAGAGYMGMKIVPTMIILPFTVFSMPFGYGPDRYLADQFKDAGSVVLTGAGIGAIAGAALYGLWALTDAYRTVPPQDEPSAAATPDGAGD